MLGTFGPPVPKGEVPPRNVSFETLPAMAVVATSEVHGSDTANEMLYFIYRGLRYYAGVSGRESQSERVFVSSDELTDGRSTMPTATSVGSWPREKCSIMRPTSVNHR